MQVWSATDVPVVPGRGYPLRLYDTPSAAVGPTTPGPTASMYVCGITPYDATHLGHAATYVAFDLVNRVWRDAGHDVRYVQNVTDVDDPLLERATATGTDWQELAADQTALFVADMAWLRVIPPSSFLGVVESMELVTELVDRLVDCGVVYEVDGDLYASARSDSGFGTVSGLDNAVMRELFGERGGDPERPGKKDPLDSLLWRRERPGEPAWDSPHGRGRPGWHVECTAIALQELGMGFDLQGGGSDLIFPHHEMCASAARQATGEGSFAQTYAHAGMMAYEGQKMSKSLGNLVLASQLRVDGADANDVRLALLAGHYRADREWTTELLANATERRSRWAEAVQVPSAPAADAVVDGVRAALADDLDTPTALALIDRWADDATAQQPVKSHTADPTAGSTVRTVVDALLGVSLPMGAR